MKSGGTLNGFRALELKFFKEAESPHYIFFKEHSVRGESEEKPSGRTLFAVNIPPYVTKQGLINAFSTAGNITAVHFYNKPSSKEIKDTNAKEYFSRKETQTFRVAYVVFEKVSELDRALKLKSLKVMYKSETKPKLGLSKWVDEYNISIPFTKALKKEIGEFMKSHDKATEQSTEKEKELQQEDDDGWITVTRKGNVSSFARTEKVESKILKKDAFGKKRKELKNFYTFQIRESKMKHIVALRQKFEEDKKMIAQIKQLRRFKPF